MVGVGAAAALTGCANYDGELWGDCATGGYSSGYAMKVSEDLTVTHDSYFAAIDAAHKEIEESMREAPTE